LFVLSALIAWSSSLAIGGENQSRPRPAKTPAARPIPIDPGKGDGKPSVVVRDHRTDRGAPGGTTVTSSSRPRNPWESSPVKSQPVVRDHRQPAKTVPTFDPLAGNRRPSWSATPTRPPVARPVVVDSVPGNGNVIVRDHRTPAAPVIRDHRTPATGPIIRDHRTPATGPIIRDHHTPAAGPIIRDHRTPATGPVIRDHRQSPVIRDHR
jgi:hypothetical protein